jgi:hypothetical protein
MCGLGLVVPANGDRTKYEAISNCSLRDFLRGQYVRKHSQSIVPCSIIPADLQQSLDTPSQVSLIRFEHPFDDFLVDSREDLYQRPASGVCGTRMCSVDLGLQALNVQSSGGGARSGGGIVVLRWC